MKATSLKDWRKVFNRIKRVRGLDEHEKVLYARSIAATPEERWRMNETYLRSLGLWGRSALKRRLEFHGLRIPVMPLESIRRSKAAVMRPKDPAHIHYISEPSGCSGGTRENERTSDAARKS